MLLEGIETLLVLEEAKTMNRAGSILYISQSAVSKRITNLEKKLGIKLIEPNGRNVRLTTDALILIKNITPTFNELCGQIYEHKSFMSDSLIHIDCSETLLGGYLSEALVECIDEDKHIKISTNHTPRIIENVKSGKAMIGICAGFFTSSAWLTDV